MSEMDEIYMAEALLEAQKASQQGEVPVGAVIVYKGEIIARGHNRTEGSCDATSHAEMECLRSASAYLGNWRLEGAALYCTLEPCAMCAGAMILSRIETLVWGAPDHRHGAHGSWANLLDIPHPIHRFQVRKGVLQKESAELLKQFFQEVRKKNV